jgi:ABC-type amino acid transport substrate-binding protein
VKPRAAAAVLLCAVLACASRAAPAEELLAVSEQWLPYLGPALPNQGFFPALVKRLFEKTGQPVRVEFYPWARALAMAKEGKAAILIGAYKTEERLAWFEFSAPIAEVTDSLFALKRLGIADYRSLRELAPYAVGVVRGAAHGREFDQADFLKKEEADSAASSVEKLIAGRVALIAGPREVIRSTVAERFPEHAGQIVELRPSLQVNPVHLAFSRRRPDAAALRASADAALDAMRNDGEYAALARRYGIHP